MTSNCACLWSIDLKDQCGTVQLNQVDGLRQEKNRGIIGSYGQNSLFSAYYVSVLRTVNRIVPMVL